ncbi:MAG: alpha/beta fold hydrolase [Planctomycetes bacterium]|nr:alpha/beta fold hydrolase [Planctomycetota bacterium]
MADPPRKHARLWVRCLRSGILIVVIPLLLLYFFQNKLLYYPEGDLRPPADYRLKGVQEITFNASDGVALVSWWRPPKSKGHPTLLFCQGNAGNISDRSDRMRDAEDAGWGLLLLGYRGYGRSRGSPNEEGIYLDTRAALTWLRAQPDVDPKKLVYYGESLGCAFASELAVAEPPAALVLEAPFKTLKAIADVHYPWLPTSILVRGRLNNIENVKKLHCAVMVIHGKRDEVVPFEQGKAVFDAALEPKKFLPLDSYHNDIPERGGEEFRKAVREFIEEAAD